MMTFQVCLKKARKPNQPRLRFSFKETRDPDVSKQQYVENMHHSLVKGMRTLTSIPWLPQTLQQWLMQPVRYLGMNVPGKKQRCSWPLWWDLKKLYKAEGEKGKANKRIQKAVRKAKEHWIDTLCEEIRTWLNKTNSKRAYKLVRNLTSEKQGRSSSIQDRSGKCLTEEQRFSADGQNTAQNYTNMRVFVTRQFCTAVSPQKKIYNQSFVRNLRSQ